MVFKIILALLFILLAIVLLNAAYYLYMHKKLAKGNYSKKEKLKFVAYLYRLISFLFNYRVEVINEHLLPEQDGFVLIGNHQSAIDPFAVIKIKRVIGFIGKIELSKIISVKEAFAWTNSLFIDRNDVRQSIKVINEGAKRVSEGNNLMIFPEGTRSLDGNLLEFKAGAFKLATKVNAPIVPVTIIGLDRFKGNYPFKTTKVKVIISEAIPASEYESLKQNELVAKVKSIIEENLQKYGSN